MKVDHLVRAWLWVLYFYVATSEEYCVSPFGLLLLVFVAHEWIKLFPFFLYLAVNDVWTSLPTSTRHPITRRTRSYVLAIEPDMAFLTVDFNVQLFIYSPSQKLAFFQCSSLYIQAGRWHKPIVKKRCSVKHNLGTAATSKLGQLELLVVTAEP